MGDGDTAEGGALRPVAVLPLNLFHECSQNGAVVL